jgi:hypothetical protein
MTRSHPSLKEQRGILPVQVPVTSRPTHARAWYAIRAVWFWGYALYALADLVGFLLRGANTCSGQICTSNPLWTVSPPGASPETWVALFLAGVATRLVIDVAIVLVGLVALGWIERRIPLGHGDPFSGTQQPLSGSPNADLLERYRNLLSELLGLKQTGGAGAKGAHRWPEILLPAPRAELGAALEEAANRTALVGPPAEFERVQLMQQLLGQFEDSWDAVASLVAQVVTWPCLLALVYGVWLGFRGDGWWWPILAVLGCAGVTCNLLLRFSNAMGNLRIAALACSALVWMSGCVAFGSLLPLLIFMVFGGVFSGLYQSVFVELSFGGILTALVASIVAWYYAKGLNTLYFLDRTPLLSSSAQLVEPQAATTVADSPPSVLSDTTGVGTVDRMAALKASQAGQANRSVAHTEPPMDDWCSCGRFDCEGGESCAAFVTDSLQSVTVQSEPAGVDGVDLMGALKASLEAAKARKDATTPSDVAF